MQFDIKPLVGIGPVRLGMSCEEVRLVMGVEPNVFQKSQNSQQTADAFHNNGFQVFYTGEQPTVEYIELSRDCDFSVFIDGIDVFSMPANELIMNITQKSNFDQNDPELGYSYVFPEWELALWRPVVPENDDENDGRYFSTIGIGIHGYFSEENG
jgi:hypothetical protein